jgi:hypothetical protein
MGEQPSVAGLDGRERVWIYVLIGLVDDLPVDLEQQHHLLPVGVQADPVHLVRAEPVFVATQLRARVLTTTQRYAHLKPDAHAKVKDSWQRRTTS